MLFFSPTRHTRVSCCDKDLMFCRWFLEILRNTLSTLPASADKPAFIYSLVEKWQDYLTALFEDSMPEYYENELVQTEFLNTLGSFTKLCSVLLQLAMPS